MWLPRWLGDTYSRLYDQVGADVFSLADAKRILRFDEGKLRAAFSALHKKRLLLLFARRRPRNYRLLKPEHFLLLAAEVVSNVDQIRQEPYLELVLDMFETCRRQLNLISFAIYGSVARGTATPTSDVDFLLLSQDFQGGLGKRLDGLVALTKERINKELGWLWRHGVYASVSFYPLLPAEANRLPFLFADLTDEAVILYDKEDFLQRVLARMKAKLIETGARRVQLNGDRWYWDLKPSKELGAMTIS